jgi:uncharacterized protein (TIGR03437 family)
MHRSHAKLVFYFAIMMGAAFLLLPASVEAQTSITRIYTIPENLGFTVDGQYFNTTVSFAWPTGSKHTLAVGSVFQDDDLLTQQFGFASWQIGTQTLSQNPLIVTADPSITEIHALFSVNYLLRVIFYQCQDVSTCDPPGTIYVNGQPTIGNVRLYQPAGAQVSLQAEPKPGFVFTGWIPGPNQKIQGFLNTVTMAQPIEVYPTFNATHYVDLETSPPKFQVLADHTPVTTPATVEWEWNTTHTVGPVSPQIDDHGNTWVFQSWSDGGEATHSYTAAGNVATDTLTATYVPAGRVGILTSPYGLKIKIDGRDSWLSNTFLWAPGETHHIEAATQQTDAQGRVYSFSSWSNGAPAIQDFVVPDSAVDPGYVLTANYQPMGHLTVNSSLSAAVVQVDGADCPSPCDVIRPVGSQVKVSAPLSVSLGDFSRADFQGWPDGSLTDRTVTLNSDPIVWSVNYRIMNRLIATADPPEGAKWQVQPTSADGFYDSQAAVQLSVSTLPGYRFRRWDGDLSGTTPSGVVPMNAPRQVRALLDKVSYLDISGVINAAGTTPQAGVAPGSIVSVFGGGLGSNTLQGPANPMVQSLGGIAVTAGDRVLPLFFVSPTQINFVLPSDLPLGQSSVTVTITGQGNLRAPMLVVRNAPGLFQQVSGDVSYAVALHADGSIVTTDSPAASGELLTLYGTGAGPTDRARPLGFVIPAQPQFKISDSVSVVAGDLSISPDNAFAAPGKIGIDAIQFRLPAGPWNGSNVSLHITVNGQDSNTVMLPVR